MLKKLSLVGLLSVAGLFSNSALAEGWVGYMNVFSNNAGSPGGFVFGSGWELADLKTTVAVSNTGTCQGDQLVLEPNFNAYNATDSFWAAGAAGNKFMEANTFVETASISTASTDSAAFSGTIDSNTLVGGYSAIAFIKVLNPLNNYSLDVFESANLVSGSTFNLTADLSAHQGKLLQLGFMVSGLNANPAAGSYGSATVTVDGASIPEPSSFALIGAGIALFAASTRRRRA